LPVRQPGHGRRLLRGAEGAWAAGFAHPPREVRQQQVGPGARCKACLTSRNGAWHAACQVYLTDEPPMKTLARRYFREFGAAMLAYTVLLPSAIVGLRHAEATWARVALAMLPVLAIAMAGRAILRFIRGSDELQRRIQVDALALAALVLCVASFALGMLSRAGVLAFDATSVLMLVLPAYALLYALFAAIA